MTQEPATDTACKNSSLQLYQTPVPALQSVSKWDKQSAFAYCTWITRNHYENFPVASIAIPKPLRPHVCAVYAFARAADDFADEYQFAGKRMENLNHWQQALQRSARERINHPVFIALSETISKFAIPLQLFEDLITAFKMDVTKQEYEDFDEVLFYCQHSANPVGRIVLHLFGYCDETRMQLADKICTALQLANFWQDVAVDLKKPRVYLPKADMQQHGYSMQELQREIFNAGFQRLMQFEVERTRRLFLEGAALINRVQGRLALELKLTLLGGMMILDKIIALEYNVLAARPIITGRDKASLLLQALLKKKPWKQK